MLKLIVDIGNTACKIAFAEGEVLSKKYTYVGEDILKFILKILGKKRPSVIIISSVRGNKEGYREELEKKCDKFIYFDSTTPIPIENLYSTPETLGPDRLAAAIAAHKLFPGDDCIIFDFGTAITIDFISKKGRYLGGNISLGLRSRFIASSQLTKSIPLLDTPDNYIEIGNSTNMAVSSGVIKGIIFEIEGYINKYPHHKVVFTGGDAFYFVEKMKKSIFVTCNLVLMGLSQIAEYNGKFKN